MQMYNSDTILAAMRAVELTMLTHGIDFASACEALGRVPYQKQSDQPPPDARHWINLCSGQWWVNLNNTRYVHPPDAAWSPYLRPIEPYLRLPMAPNLIDSFDDIRDPESPAAQALMDPNLIDACRTNLRSIGDDYGVLASLGRLPYVYRDWAYRFGADAADVFFLTGLQDRDISYAPTYTCRKAADLVDLHLAILRAIAAGLAPVLRKRLIPSAQSLQSTQQNYSVGSVRTPTTEAMKTLFTGVHELITRSRSSRKRIVYHNALTLYVILSLTLATLSRPTSTRFMRRSDFSSDFRYVHVSDKDRDSYLGSRVLPLIERIVALLMFYESERASLLEWLSIHQDAAVRAVESFADGTPITDSRYEEYQARLKSPSLLFYLSPGYEPLNVTREMIGHEYARWFKPGLYTLRHYMRTRLRELGVSGYVLDYAMGHGILLASAHHKYSTLDLSQIADTLLVGVNAVFDEIDWQPVTEAFAP